MVLTIPPLPPEETHVQNQGPETSLGIFRPTVLGEG
jgi:hypothetical protein